MTIVRRLTIIALFVTLAAPALVSAQNQVLLGARNPVQIDGPAFIPFDQASRQQLDESFAAGNFVAQCRAVQIKGSNLELGPAVNGFEIGPRKKVKKKKKNKKGKVPVTVCDIDFSSGPGACTPGSCTWGVSVVGKGSVALDIQKPGNCDSPVTCESDENSARKCSTATNQKCCEADDNGNVKKKCRSDGKKCGCFVPPK